MQEKNFLSRMCAHSDCLVYRSVRIGFAYNDTAVKHRIQHALARKERGACQLQNGVGVDPMESGHVVLTIDSKYICRHTALEDAREKVGVVGRDNNLTRALVCILSDPIAEASCLCRVEK